MTLSTAATSPRTRYENDAERFVPKKRSGLSRLFSCCCASDEKVERATVAVLGSGERLSPRSVAPTGHERHSSGSGRALLQGANVVKHGSMDSATHHLVARTPSPDQTLSGVVQEDERRLAPSQGGLNDSVVSAGVVLGDASSVNGTTERSFATTFLSGTPTPGPGATPQVTPPGSGDHPLLSATPSGSTVDAGNVTGNVTGNNRSPFSVGSTSSSGSRSTGGTPTFGQGDGSTVASRLLFAGNQ